MNRIESPVVSVVMPAYNGAKYIGEAIESVISQTMTDWELIIIDDCSKDNTYEIALEYANIDARIRVIQNEVNSGVSRTRNKGMDQCKGAYVALLDCDDIWRSDKLEVQLDIAKRTGADIIYCSYALVDDKGISLNRDFIVPVKTDFEDMLIKSVISCSTVLLSKKIVDTYRFTPDFYHEDYVLWMQLLKDGFIAEGSEEVLASYRLLEKSRSANKLNSAMKRWDIYRKYLHLPFIKSCVVFVKYSLAGLKKYY